MERTQSGLVIVKKAYCKNIKAIASLTMKATKDGKIKHAVVLTSPNGLRMRLRTFEGISGAWDLFQTMVNA